MCHPGKGLDRDDAIAAARSALGGARFERVRDYAKDLILAEIATDLRDFGVEFDCWYSETSLTRDGAIDAERSAERD